MSPRALFVAVFIGLSLLPLAAQADASFTIVGQNDLRYSKDHLRVAPGESVTIKLVNKSHLPASAMAHNWVLLKHSADPGAFDDAAQSAPANDYFPQARADQTIAHTGMVAGGESDTVTFTAPEEPGDYIYICTFPRHFAAGMKGVLTVQ